MLQRTSNLGLTTYSITLTGDNNLFTSKLKMVPFLSSHSFYNTV